MKNLFFILCIFLSILSCKDNKKSSAMSENDNKMSKQDSIENLSTAERIAYENGYENWKDISEMHFTFNVDRGDKHSERNWVWKAKTQETTMMTDKDTVSYNRGGEMDKNSKNADAAFINDEFWLLAPFNLMWDKGMEISEEKNATAPISKDKLNKLTVVYADDSGGYTPGDAYDFFYDDNYKIKEWNYRQGNDSIPTMTTTWEDYKNYDGLNLATMHKDSTGNFKLYFTNISVKK